RVAGPMRDQPAEHRLADQSEVAKQVQRLVPYKLIRKTERCIVEHSVLGQDYGILQRAAADQTAGLKLFDFMIEAECPGRRNEFGIVGSGEFDLDALFPDQRMRKINVVLDGKCARWINAKRLAVLSKNEVF